MPRLIASAFYSTTRPLLQRPAPTTTPKRAPRSAYEDSDSSSSDESETPTPVRRSIQLDASVGTPRKYDLSRLFGSKLGTFDSDSSDSDSQSSARPRARCVKQCELKRHS